MAHDHSHHRHKNVLPIAIIILFVFALIEAISGMVANSLTLLSDAGHMAADGASLVLAAVAAWISRKPPSRKHSYGLGRAEVLGAWISSLFMVLIAVFLIYHAILRFNQPEPVHAGTVIEIATLGLLVNVVLMWILHHAEPTLNLRAAILHVVGDLLGSLAALISGIIIYFTHWFPIDPLLSIFIAVLILISSFNLLRETLLVLMEGVPLHLDLAEVGKSMAGAADVVAVHDLHIWTLSSGLIALTAHVEIQNMQQWEATLQGLRRLLSENFSINHVTLQPETREKIVQIQRINNLI
ncbi:MAG: cation diffusion facilitator family transporter [Gammaproteobacteria bacterium]